MFQKHAAVPEEEPPTDVEELPTADEELPTADEEVLPTDEEDGLVLVPDDARELDGGAALVPADVLDVPALETGALEDVAPMEEATPEVDPDRLDDATDVLPPALEDGALEDALPAEDVPTDVEPTLAWDDPGPGWLVARALEESRTTPLLEPPAATVRHTPSTQWSSRVQSASALHVRAQVPSTSTEPEGQDCEHPATMAAPNGPSITTTAQRWRGENTPSAYHAVLS